MKLTYKMVEGKYGHIGIDFGDDKYFLSNVIGEFDDRESVDYLLSNVLLTVKNKWNESEIFSFQGGIDTAFVYPDKTYFYNKDITPIYIMDTKELLEIIKDWRYFVYAKK